MKDANDLLVEQGPEGFVRTWGRLVSEATAMQRGAASEPPAPPASAAAEKSAALAPRVAPAPPAPAPGAAPRPPAAETAAAKKENGQEAERAEGAEHVDPREQGRDAPELVLDAEGTYLLKLGSRTWRVKGLSSFGVDRLRVNVRVDEAGRFHVDTFDLYSARSRNTFVEASVRALGLRKGEEAAVEDEVRRLIAALEKERLSLRHHGLTEVKPLPMSDAEREEALAFLRSASLIDLIKADFDAIGLVGEKEALLTGYLALISRMLPKPLSVLFCARSGAGKSALQDALCDFVPPEDLIKYTRISGQVLFYKDENALVRKVLAVEEEEGANQAAYALRSLLSNGYLSCSVTRIDPKTGRYLNDDHKVNGPTTVLLTSAHPETLDYETRNRFILLTVDESREQTARILTRQMWGESLEGLLADERKTAILRRHRNAQRLLQPLRVVIPFPVSFPKGYLILRREQRKYLTLLQAIALLHQHQRPKKTALIDGKAVEYIEVTKEDVEIARPLAALILKRNLDELAPPARSLYVAMRDLSREKKAALEKAEKADAQGTRGEAPQAPRKPGAPRRYLLRASDADERDALDERLALERREIQRGTGLSLWHIKTYMPQLLEYGYVLQLTGSRGRTCLYLVLDVEDPDEPEL